MRLQELGFLASGGKCVGVNSRKPLLCVQLTLRKARVVVQMLPSGVGVKMKRVGCITLTPITPKPWFLTLYTALHPNFGLKVEALASRARRSRGFKVSSLPSLTKGGEVLGEYLSVRLHGLYGLYGILQRMHLFWP